MHQISLTAFFNVLSILRARVWVCVCKRGMKEGEEGDERERRGSCYEHYLASYWSMWLRWHRAEKGNWDSEVVWSNTKRKHSYVMCFRQAFVEGGGSRGRGRGETPDMSLVIMQRALSGWWLGVIREIRHAGSQPKESLNIPERKYHKRRELDRTRFGKLG